MRLNQFMTVAVTSLVSISVVHARLPGSPPSSTAATAAQSQETAAVILKPYGQGFKIQSKLGCVADCMQHGYTQQRCEENCGGRAEIPNPEGRALIRQAADECDHHVSQKRRAACVDAVFRDAAKAKSQEAFLHLKPVAIPSPAADSGQK